MIMRTVWLLILIFISACSMNQRNKMESTFDLVPSLDELSGAWVSYDTVDMEPSIRNFRGQALANRDLTSFSYLAAAPYSGGYHTGTIKVNGESPKVDKFRWQPYQIQRHAIQDMVEINAVNRMVPDKNIILWEVKFTNTSGSKTTLNVYHDFIGFMGHYPDQEWQWWYPYPTLEGQTTKRTDDLELLRKHIGTGIVKTKTMVTEFDGAIPVTSLKEVQWPSDDEILNSTDYSTVSVAEANQTLVVVSQSTEVTTKFTLLDSPDSVSIAKAGGSASWQIELEQEETKSIRFAMTYGAKENNINIDNDLFAKLWSETLSVWEKRWQQIFMPNNELISGTFPVLETDDEKAKKVYYTGPLTMLYLMHNNLPQHEKVFLTGGPRWGASLMFFWDITEWSTLWAVVDPEMMKDHLTSWIQIDPSKYYGQDNFGGGGSGNGYSANYWALFQMIRGYITISQDYAFLDQVIDGKSVMDHLEYYATNWERISIYGQDGCTDDIYKLADFGDDEWNLLEAVPTYKHIVPSFNAGYIWMMRETADLLRTRGNSIRADELELQAKEMIERLLKLYAGDGVWYSQYPNNKKVEVRHSLDFMFLGRYIPSDIPEDIRKEMMDFAYRELLTDNWMRAQSMDDVAAKDSDRPDHGPLGAFDGWPAGTMDALTQLGFPQKALDFYHAIEPVTHEGIWAQAHELYGENKNEKNAKVRIAQRGWHNRESSAGIAMSQVMLKDFFGFYPDADGQALIDISNFDFEGTLHHVKYGQEYFKLELKDGKVEMTKEQ